MTRLALVKGRKGAAWWIHSGSVFVSANLEGGFLSSLRVEFHGELARLPSLKNSKLPGKNFINPDTLDRLQAMQVHFERSARVYPSKALHFQKEPLVALLVCSKRKTRFDLDNCAASVKDWLEPNTKRGRGWGVGVVEDDSQLTVFPIHASQYEKQIEYSLLLVRRWADVQGDFRRFSESAFDGV